MKKTTTNTTNTDLKEQIWQSIKDLPEKNINEILNFIAFTKSKVYQQKDKKSEDKIY